jgi:hypothetical protein
MTTPQRPIIGAEAAPSKEIVPAGGRPPQTTTAPEMLIAMDLPPWDLLPSDLLVVRRRTPKK